MIILFLIYLLLFTWVVTKTGFFNNSGLTRIQLIALFLLKVLFGIFYGWIGIYELQPGQINDTWAHHYNSLKETQLLFENPGSYFSNIFDGIQFNSVAGFFASSNSYWNNLKWNAYIKLISVFNCFSFGNYYINVIFYSYLTFFGSVAIYRVMRNYIAGNNLLTIAGVFLVPSFIFWCSGLHKDGITFLAIALITYHFYFYVVKEKARFSSWAVISIAAIALFIFRNHLLVTVLPALAAWYWSVKAKGNPLKYFAIVYIIGTGLFFGLKYIHASLDFPAFVAEKQDAFDYLAGNTSIRSGPLEPTVTGFIKKLPQAISYSMFRPFLSDIAKFLAVPAFLEMLFIWILILVVILRYKNFPSSGFSLFVLFFCTGTLLMIGYSVNNLGAILRYRSFLFPLFVPLLLTAICRQKEAGRSISKKNGKMLHAKL